MLFKTKFHEGIRNGSITLTFRAWKSARAKVGKQYRFGPEERVEVEAVEEVEISTISDEEAHRSGFTSATELRSFLLMHSPEAVTPKSTLFRVSFHYVKISDEVPQGDLSLEEITEKLEKMDRLSKYGPWTRQTLEIIAQNPRTAASKLAPLLGRETRPFKADVRKLKKLGLTVSFEVGYELTSLGKAFLCLLFQLIPQAFIAILKFAYL